MWFKYSKQAYKVLWLFLIVITWVGLVSKITIIGSPGPLDIFFMYFGFGAFFTLIFLTILDIIEWRYPKR